MAFDTPHLAWPIRRAADGSFAAVEQDSREDMGQRVALAVQIRQGSLLYNPQLGRPALPKQTSPVGVLEQTIRQWVPDADDELVDEGVDHFMRTITVRPATDG